MLGLTTDECSTDRVFLYSYDDLYYGYEMLWKSKSDNSTLYNIKGISFKKNIYDSEKNIFNTLNNNVIKTVMDIKYRITSNRNMYVLDRKIEKNSKKTQYTIYYIEQFILEGIHHKGTLYKEITVINNITKKIEEIKKEKIKDIFDSHGEDSFLIN